MVRVEICQGTSCHLLGSRELVQAVERLPADLQERFSLCLVDCLGNCRQGPSIRIGEVTYSGVTPEILDGILRDRLDLAAD